MIVDAHQHFWTADYAWLAAPALAPIRRDYEISDLSPLMAAAGVDRTVLVEAGRCDAAETSAFLELAGRTPEIAGVVGWASLTSPALAASLDEHRAGPGGHLLVGIRDQVQAFGDDHLDGAAARRGLATVASAGLVNELVVRSAQLPSVARAAAGLPSSLFVLDHLGKPPVAAGDWKGWRELIAPVAAQPNVVAKVSGLVAEANWESWTAADLRPFVEIAAELFGTSRLMYGSDWPVLEVAANYGQVKDVLADLLGGLLPEVFGGTAIRTYQLEIP
ncbi:amidohydrolase family protein [Actinoplanes sp. TBRC 11911]|uniref:amidohydrolase family protein n=1 Tax=Actinoplanes sp. TBRC 11911 TaxID=2729386 RepID=UPI00145DCD18|nr:amidohydrolase family protein [Actinoplanes sp. TBRC 11911]NMO53988.1 amidohydrolase family protein [Actinoplanes sp. TBRC 11911]